MGATDRPLRAWGVDGCKKGWFCIGIDSNRAEYRVVASLKELVDVVPDDTTVLIDIPIGLLEQGSTERRCDLDARRLLSPVRHSSVFPVPCRQAIDLDSYEAASELNRKILGRGLSKQSHAIAPKIAKVDELVRAKTASRPVIREVHPEVCFAALAGHAMDYNKKTREGFHERLAVLEPLVPLARETIADAFLEHGGFEVARDDIVDAMVAALCARHIDECHTLPESPPIDSKGLPMEMVYLPQAVADELASAHDDRRGRT